MANPSDLPSDLQSDSPQAAVPDIGWQALDGHEVLVTMADGQVYQGTLVLVSDPSTVIVAGGGRSITLPRADIIGIALQSASKSSVSQVSPPAEATPPPVVFHAPGQGPASGAEVVHDPERLHRIRTRDKQLYFGWIVNSNANEITLALEQGGSVSIARHHIHKIDIGGPIFRRDNQIWDSDPNRTRYLYTPSAFFLRPGEGYFAQKSLLVSELGVGATRWLGFLGGISVPLIFAAIDNAQLLNFVLGAKAGGPVHERVRLAAGFQVMALPFTEFGVFGLGFGTMTVGHREAHVSLSAGVPFRLAKDPRLGGHFLTTLSGNLRIAKRVALVTEHWMVPLDTKFRRSVLAHAFGPRFIWRHLSLDAGFIFTYAVNRGIAESWLPMPIIPWVDIAYNF